jgi:pimeloyl-ACP methyl ester carboxylesterase
VLEPDNAWIATPEGRLFARRWRPRGSAAPPTDETPLVLLHDSLGCVELWREFPARLCDSTGLTVIAYDRLGFGRSDPYRGALTPDFIRMEAVRSLPPLGRQLGFDHFIALGHSVGGAMAVHCAVALAAACRAVITESAQAFVEARTLEGIRAAQREFQKEGQLERLEKYHGDKARWVLDAWVQTWLSPQFTGWSLTAALPQVRCPVLAIHGDEDEYGSIEHAQRIAAGVAGRSELEILKGCGHVPHREREAEVVSRVKSFLMLLGVAVATAAAPHSPAASQADPFMAAGISYAEAGDVLRQLQHAVAAHDARAVAALTEFPLTVNGRRGPTNAAELAREFTSIYNDKVSQAVLRQTVDGLFANWKGLMMGRGEVWIRASCENGSPPGECRNRQVRVFAINN